MVTRESVNVNYTARVEFTFTLTLSEVAAEILHNLMSDNIQNGAVDAEEYELERSIVYSIRDGLQEAIQGAHRLGLEPRKPVTGTQPSIVIQSKEN